MIGVFVCVVGPSGAGKDTLIDGARRVLASDEGFVFPRRIVTREASGAEDHDTVTTESFREIEANAGFAVCWQAHGLSYAIPGEVLGAVHDGCIVVCNLSRAAITEARSRFGSVRVVTITAPKDLLRERLLARGRESMADIDARLDREAAKTPGDVDLVIENVGDVRTSIATLVDFLTRLRNFDQENLLPKECMPP